MVAKIVHCARTTRSGVHLLFLPRHVCWSEAVSALMNV